MIHWGTGNNNKTKFAPREIEYTIVNGKDSKEYLVVYYVSSVEKYLLILNDKTEIIGNFTNEVIEDDNFCFSYLKTMEDPLYSIKDNNVYYYKSLTSIKDSGKGIKLELMEIEIANNTATEKGTGKITSGHYGQCK